MKKLASLLTINGLVPTYEFDCLALVIFQSFYPFVIHCIFGKLASPF